MPLNPDGTYTATMPSTSVLDGAVGNVASPKRGRADILRNPPKISQKQPFATFESPPTFVDHMQLRAAKDDRPLSSYTKSELLTEAEKFGDTILPGHYRADGEQVDKSFNKANSTSFQHHILNNYDAIQKHFKSLDAENPVQTPVKAGTGGLGDLALDTSGKTVGAVSRAVGGVGHALNYLDPFYAYSKALGTGEYAAGIDKDVVNKGINAIGTGGNSIGQSISNIASPEYKTATSQPLTTGDLSNPSSLGVNPQGVTPMNVASKVLGTAAQAVPVIAATLLGGPVAGAAAGGGQFGETAREEEYARIKGMPEPELTAVPAYQALLKQGLHPEAAREQLAKHAAEVSFGVGGGVGALTSLAPLAPFSNTMKNLVGGGLLKRAAVGGVLEGGVMGSAGVAQNAAQVAASNAATGEKRDPLAGAPELFAEGALAGLPFGVAGAGKGGDVPGKPTTPTKGTTTTNAPKESNATPIPTTRDTLTAAARQASTESPFPTPEALTKPEQAQAHYNEWVSAAKADLEGQGLSEEQAAAAEPQLKQVWAAQAKVDPAILELPTQVPSSDTEAQVLTQATPDELSAATNVLDAPTGETPAVGTSESTPAAVRGAAEAVISPELPQAVATRVSKDLQQTLGREPTGAEVARETEQVVKEAVNGEGVNKLIPEQARTEAVDKLVAKKGELPTAEEINTLAKSLAKELREPKTNILKKKSPEEPAYNASQDVSREPTGRTVADVRQALAARIGERATAALEKSGVLKLVQGVKDTPVDYHNQGPFSGLYTPQRKAYLVADHIAPGAEWRTLVHEVGVHYGLRSMLPKTLYSALEQHIEQTRTQDTPEGREVAAAWSSAEKAGTDPRIQTNETIAHMVQSRLAHIPGSVWNRAWAAVRAFAFDKIGRYLPTTVSRKLLDNAVIAQLAKSATGRAAELRAQDRTAQQVDARSGLGVPAFNRAGSEKELSTVEKVFQANRVRPVEPNDVPPANPMEQSHLQQFTTRVFDVAKPLLHLRENLAKQGTKLDASTDLFDAYKVAKNKMATAQKMAKLGTVDPFINKIAERATARGITPDRYAEDFANYYTAKNALERNQRYDLEHVSLTEQAAIARQQIKEAWADKKYASPGSYIAALKTVVDAPGARRGGKPLAAGSGLSDKDAKVILAKLRHSGFTDAEASETRNFYKAAVESINTNYRNSKRFSSYDEARRTGLGSEWYLPSLGHADEAYSPTGGNGAFTKQYQGLGGRSEGDIGRNGLVSLLSEVSRSASDTAENEFMKVAYQLGKEHGTKLGIKVTSFNAEKAAKEAITTGKGLDEAARMAVSENAVVYNNGAHRFAIEFPKNSPQLEVIKAINKDPELAWWLKPIAFGTNIVSRLDTTWSLPFLTWNSMWRDTVWNSSLIGLDHGPLVLARYAKNYWGKGGPLGTLPVFFTAEGHPRNALERAHYAEQSSNEMAHDWQTMVRHGGDLAFDQALNLIKSLPSLQKELANAAKPNAPVITQARALVHVLDHIGTVQIVAPRIAAFRAVRDTYLEKLGHKPSAEERDAIDRKATLYARNLLDYQQTSEVGRNLNALFNFARVQMISADRTAQSFKNPDGSFNARKAAMTAGVGLAAGALWYAFQRQTSPAIQQQTNETLASNFVIPFGDTVYKLPMAYGPTRLMLVPGMMLARLYSGDSSAEDAANTIRNVVVDSALPFKMPVAPHNESPGQFAADFLTAVTPSIPRPGIELIQNRNSFGSPIAPEHVNQGLKAASGWANTPEMWKELALTMSIMGVDVYPEQLQYIFASYTGGPGALALRSEKFAEGKGTSYPLLPSVISHDAEHFAQRKFYDTLDDLHRYKSRMDYAKEQGPGAVSALRKNEPTIETKLSLLKQMDSEKTKFYKTRKVLMDNKMLSEPIKKAQLERLTAGFTGKTKQLVERSSR